MNTNSDSQASTPPIWPLQVNLNTPEGENNNILIQPGITVLVGPNGSGKTQALRSIKNHIAYTPNILNGRNLAFQAAGRSSPLEAYRAAVNSTNVYGGELAVGNHSDRHSWAHYESHISGLLVIESRPDLRLLVEARLQQLLDRSIRLIWTQSGLQVDFVQPSSGRRYSAKHEASGILHIVALLALIHNDEIGALLIDEPEISLHPQHQAFLLEEIQSVAGDPSDPRKKIIIIATHSEYFLPLQKISDIPSFVFFNKPNHSPLQIDSKNSLLGSNKLSSLISRLSSTHKAGLFAAHILLVEGPSDEIILRQLANTLGIRLSAGNAQIIPVIGKGEFIEAAKLFTQLGKQVTILADLDAFIDKNNLVNYFSEFPQSKETAEIIGQPSLVELDRVLRTDLDKFIAKNEAHITSAANSYPNWSSNDDEKITKRRLTLARLLTNPKSFNEEIITQAESLQKRFEALLSALEKSGCFFLRSGAIENCFITQKSNAGKPQAAAEEAASFNKTEISILNQNYTQAINSIKFTAPIKNVDEDKILRPKLAAALAAIFQEIETETNDATLNEIAKSSIGIDASIFNFSNLSNKDEICVTVSFASKVFKRSSFPFSIKKSENPNEIIPKKLSGHYPNGKIS